MAVTNTGIVLRTITGVNESDLFLDSESTSVATNTGVVERSVVGVHDANFVHPLGDELITNGDFSDWTNNNPDNWLVLNEDANNYVTESLSGDELRMISNNTATLQLRQENITTAGVTYKIVVDVTEVISGSIRFQLNSQTQVLNSVGLFTFYVTADVSGFFAITRQSACDITIDNVSVKEMLVNRESTATNTGIVERPITGVNDGGDLFLDESTSVVNNTGIVERPITGVNESDALFPDNTDSTVVNISDTIIPLLTALEARATTFENREGTQNILINLQKC